MLYPSYILLDLAVYGMHALCGSAVQSATWQDTLLMLMHLVCYRGVQIS